MINIATIRDVSKLAGVSVATVSRVINKKGYVSKETEKAILDAMKKLNYTPSDVARRLAGKKSNTIGLIIPNILNPFFPQVARAAEDIANKLGYNLILCNTDNSREKENQYYEMLLNKQVDGIIISSYTATPNELLALIDRGMPIVVLDREFKEYDIPSINVDNRQGGRLAAKHLIECGCKKIAHIAGPTYIESFQDRLLGFKDYLSEVGLYSPDIIVSSDFSLKDGYEATKVLVKEKGVDAIFACSDLLAIGCYKALKEMGYESFEKVKLIGYDGLEANINYLELSSVAQPMYGLGKGAVELLIKKIEENSDISKEKIKLQPEIVARESTLPKRVTF
ncbi:LacI family DNA-binding transcriptional regulator [Clostridium saudiense]|nr:LacI family DNA-binding transcriptional regulator [Clostridium saudiense]